jgi:hypothetical protein
MHLRGEVMRTIEEIRAAKRHGMPLSDDEIDRLSKFWRSGATTNPLRRRKFKITPASFLSRFIPPTSPKGEVKPVQPGILQCSFCKCEVSRLEATTGKASRILVSEEILTMTPELVMGQKVYARSIKVVACPKCVGKIKPRVDREGNYISHNVNYDDFSI